MKFLDSNGVRKIKEYVDNKFVTADAYSVIEGVERDTYTKQEIDTMLADIDSDTDLTNYYTKTESDNRYATTAQIPTRTSQLTNNSGFITSESDPVFSASAAAGITSSDITNWNSKTSNTGTVTQVKVGSTAYNPSSGIVSLPAYPTTLPASDVSSWAKASTKPSYTASEVGAATQSDINTAIQNLIGTAPEALNTLGEIADALNDDANLASTLTNQISAKYTKPSTGIPKGDLASTVQASLNKADTALQSYTETDPTVPAWAKAANKPTYTAAEVGALPSTTVIPAAPGTLKTDATAAQTVSSGEAMSGTITLHKVAKTGTYSDLIGTPTIPTESTVSGWGFTKNAAANNATITIQKGGTNVDSFTVNASSNKSINIPNELPSYSSADSGKILSVNSSGQLIWITPVSIYTGSGEPNNANGNDGDIYLQS